MREWEIDETLARFDYVSTDTNYDDLGKREQVKNIIADRDHRRNLVHWVEWVVSLWLIGVLCVVVLCGASLLSLDKIVLDVLLATTTVNILGLAHIVLKGLFK